MPHNPRTLLAAIALLLLAACGQMGPLYLPEDTPTQPTEAGNEATAPIATENSGSGDAQP